eukprot:SAG31_NODE_16606_length_702_cov_8.417910_1_plen_66_part_00
MPLNYFFFVGQEEPSRGSCDPELGVISVGADGVISATAPPAEIAHYDDGKMQALIDSHVSIDDIF